MIERLWCECREIWQRQLIEQGYSSDVVTGWFQATDVVLDDTAGATAATTTTTDDNVNLPTETHPTTVTNSNSPNHSDDHHRPHLVVNTNTNDTYHTMVIPPPPAAAYDDHRPFTAWAKLRRLNRRLFVWGEATTTSTDDDDTITTATTTIPRIIIEQLDRFGHGNETYWIKDAYPAIQQYANEQIDIRLHYNVTSPHPSLTTSGATTMMTDGAPHNNSSSSSSLHPLNDQNEESMRLLLLVDRKRKSVNKKKLVWDESLQQYTSKAPAVKRIRKSPLDPSLLMPSTTILPDVPRYPYPDTTTTTLDWKRNMDRLYHNDYFLEYIHLPPPTAPLPHAPPSTSLLIGALCDTGQYHLFRQVASSSSTTDPSVHHQRRLHRRAIRARLGNHIPLRMSDDFHGRTNRSDHQPNKPWSKLLRTMSLAPTTRDTSSSNTTTTASIPITDGSTPNEPRVVVVLETPHYWFDFDTGYCILEYVMEGKRTVGAFSNIELSLCDE